MIIFIGVLMYNTGCILFEMIARRPLFPGKNFMEQLSLIFDAIGAPTAQDTRFVCIRL